MVKKLLISLFFHSFLLGTGFDTRLAQESINALSKQEISLSDVAMAGAFRQNGGLNLAYIEQILGARLDRERFSKNGFEIKFISQTGTSALLFVKGVKSALLGLSSHSESSFISRSPLEYAVSFESFSDTFGALDEALIAQGFKVSQISRSDFGVSLLLDDSAARLNLTQIEPQKSIMLLDANEFALSSDVSALELSSRGKREWAASIRVYDARLNEILLVQKEPNESTLRVQLPENSAYVVVSDVRGVSRGAVVLKAFANAENGANLYKED